MPEDTKEPGNTSVSEEVKQPETEPHTEVVTSEPETVLEIPVETSPETETPQMGGNEPLPEKVGAGATAEAPKEESRTPEKVRHEETKPEPSQKEKLGLLRQMARATIQLRREKKLVKIMTLFVKQTEITNDEVEKLLHVSDATATRYLTELEKRGKLKQVGTTGRNL